MITKFWRRLKRLLGIEPVLTYRDITTKRYER